MDKAALEKTLGMLASGSDTDIVMALKAVEGLLAEEGITVAAAVQYAIDHADDVRKTCMPRAVSVAAAPDATPEKDVVSVSGMPECRVAAPGCIEIVVSGEGAGTQIELTGESAAAAQEVADHLKDAMVAAVINKSRFKLKLVDIKNGRGEVEETILQAEYDRDGMTPVKVWSNVRGEVAGLATVLRRAVKDTVPDLVA
ncbi:MAG: hypothetical protein OXT65_07510 [Alphaproteobacteria bacterium]|nr:hypothetical protein [Alphaproteobacteria bacterium]